MHYHRLGKLNYCVRDGNRCGLSDMFTGKEPDGPVDPPGSVVALVIWHCSRQHDGQSSDGREAWKLLDRSTVDHILESPGLKWSSFRPLVLVS